MSDLSTFLKAVAEDLPTFEHLGTKFKVRAAAPDDRQKAIEQLRRDQVAHTPLSSTDNDPLTPEQVASWIKHTTEGNEGAVRLFDLDTVKTQRDLKLAMFRISYLTSYIFCASLLTEDGQNIPDEMVFPIAKTIATTVAFKSKIEKALASLNEADDFPNG